VRRTAPAAAAWRARGGPDVGAFVPLPDDAPAALVEPIGWAARPGVPGSDGVRWWQPEARLRDRALVLLGFTRGAGLTPVDLAALDIHHVLLTAEGIEVRLYRRAGPSARLGTAVPLGAWYRGEG
jgi:hypothetical protein